LVGGGQEDGVVRHALLGWFEAGFHGVEQNAAGCVALGWGDVKVEHDEHVGLRRV